MDRDSKRLEDRGVYRKQAECVLELLELGRSLPSGDRRNAVVSTMNDLADLVTDLRNYLETGDMSPDLRSGIQRQCLTQADS